MPSQRPDYSRVALDDYSDNSGNNNNHHTAANGGGSSSNGTHQQQQLMQQQDEGLEMLGQSAVRLGEMSLQISEELNYQNNMLSDMDDQLDTAQNDLDVVTRRTKEFIAASGGTRNCVVMVALGVTIVILVFLIIYV